MSVGASDLVVDHELSEISGMLPFLRLVTPINVAEARSEFLSGETTEPEFRYAPLPDLTDVGRRLEKVDPESAEDPAIRHMAAALKRELDIRIDLIGARGSARFFLAAVDLFGHVDDTLLKLANDLLEIEPDPSPEATIAAPVFAAAAQAEITRYKEVYPEMRSRVIVSDTATGVMVENGDLYIGSTTRVIAEHVETLLHHEIGVHVLTFANGSAQPLHMLATGLAGYDENQEALGVLAEHLGGGLRRRRLHTLAYRVVAAQLRSDQATFRETFNRLVELGASKLNAFATTMRAYRAGGMTKDAIYLRGLVRLCQHLAAGGDLESLFVGKVALADEPLVSELRQREVLGTPPLRPRFLDLPTARLRLDAIRAGLTVRQIGGIQP